MAKQDTKDLLEFLTPFGEEVKDKVMFLREFVWALYPKTNELIFDSYNAVAFDWSITERLGHTFCSIAVGRSIGNIHFGFYWGNEIADPEKKLIGGGNQYRYLLFTDLKSFPKAHIKKLVKEAYANSLAKVKNPAEISDGKTIVKAVAAKKREKKVARK